MNCRGARSMRLMGLLLGMADNRSMTDPGSNLIRLFPSNTFGVRICANFCRAQAHAECTWR
jgi:hypothetical protein